MLLVVGPGLLIVENGTFRTAFPHGVKLLRLDNHCRERDPSFLAFESIHTLFHQINSTLAKFCIDFLLQPGMWLMTVV